MIEYFFGTHKCTARHYVDGLMQERRYSIANALQLRFSCINLSMYDKHRRSKVSVQAACGNVSNVSHKPLLISNDWIKNMLYEYVWLKITYLGILSMEVYSCKLILCITNDQSKHKH